MPSKEEIQSVLNVDREIIRRRNTDEPVNGDTIEELSFAYGIHERSNATAGREEAQSGRPDDDVKDEKNEDADDNEYEEEPITLPESTHSMLFTEHVMSIPFAYAVLILAMSILVLLLALMNNIDFGSDNKFGIPANVDTEVKVAQYLAIIMLMIMEEEIPTGLQLLRMIPKKSLKTKLPRVKYWKFVISALWRLILGYLLLINAVVVVIQSSGVLDIFYDVLALQFVQQLDDIAFGLAKMEVLGRRLRLATCRTSYQIEFEKGKFARFRSMGLLLKAIYFVNLFLGLFSLGRVTARQKSGYYQCTSISVLFGNEVWNNALVKGPSGGVENRFLIYSYFSGTYVADGEPQHDRRPVYVEQRKFGDGEDRFEMTIPAKLMYCDSETAWVLTHPHIKKSMTDESECPWLLKSPETDAYDLLDVRGEWTAWTGVLVNGAQVSIACNECNGEADCNYNGVCSENSQCVCGEDFTGVHCELERPCRVIEGARDDVWSISVWDSEELGYDNFIYRYYGRAVYDYRGLRNGTWGLPEGDTLSMFYSGSRWFGAYFAGDPAMSNETAQEVTLEDIEAYFFILKEYHSFWYNAYSSLVNYTSDPTTASDPIGVDFFWIGERGDQYGPFGVLYPLQDPPGRGMFRCIENEEGFWRNSSTTERKLRFHHKELFLK